MKRFEGKVVIVTGASRGIGKQIAVDFAKEGALVIGIARNEEKLKEVKNFIEENNGKFEYYAYDILDFEKTEEVIKEIYKKYERIDILVNNAGITKDMFLIMMKTEDFKKIIDVNLTAAFVLTKNVAKYMRKRKEGVIINISSIVGIDGNIGQSNYAASKAGLIALTKTWAKELTLKGENIRVNAVAPGFIETDMTKNLSEDIKKLAIEKALIKRLGKPEDVSKVVLFLASDDASYITGQVIRVDGGLTL